MTWSGRPPSLWFIAEATRGNLIFAFVRAQNRLPRIAPRFAYSSRLIALVSTRAPSSCRNSCWRVSVKMLQRFPVRFAATRKRIGALSFVTWPLDPSVPVMTPLAVSALPCASNFVILALRVTVLVAAWAALGTTNATRTSTGRTSSIRCRMFLLLLIRLLDCARPVPRASFPRARGASRLHRRVHVRLQHRAREAVDRMRLEDGRIRARAPEPAGWDWGLDLLARTSAPVDPQHIDPAVCVGRVDD